MSVSTDKIKGSILAMAIGDALGAAVEGFSAEKIASIYGQLREFSQVSIFYSSLDERTDISKSQIRELKKRKIPIGLYTDDTQQAILLIETLVDKGIADRYDYANRIIDVVNRTKTKSKPLGVFRGYGRGFKQVVDNLLKGISPDRAAVDSAGNGAAMRIAPVGLFFHDNPKKAAQQAIEISMLTHKDVRAILSACAVAISVSLSVESKTILSEKEFFGKIISYLHKIKLPEILNRQEERIEQFFASADILAEHLSDSYQIASRKISEYVNEITGQYMPAEHPFCLCSVMMSFWHFLHNRDSTEEAIISAVNAGGDADTIGAITGAMIGALKGDKSIPYHWVKSLKNRNQLKLRAQAIIAGTKELEGWQDFIEMEQNVCDS